MPSIWSIALDGPAAPQIPWEAGHAVISRWLDTDHKAPAKPYALTLPAPGEPAALTVRLLDDGLAGRLADQARVGSSIRLGRHEFTITQAPVLQSGISWAALCDTAGGDRGWQVTYCTPTTFRTRSRTSPWPAPESVLTSLLARWRALDPATAPDLSGVAMRSVWVSDVDGRSRTLRLRDTVVSAFIGRIRYVVDGTSDDAATVGALMGFARFAGVGSHTAFGLGQVEVRAHLSGPGRPGTTDAVDLTQADDAAHATT